MNQEHQTWARHWEVLSRKHPLIHFLVILGIAFLTGPLMIAASNMTAVLYKDF